MTVSNILSKKDFDKAIQEGIYTILPFNADTPKESEYTYYKVEYLSPALNKSTFIVGVYS